LLAALVHLGCGGVPTFDKKAKGTPQTNPVFHVPDTVDGFVCIDFAKLKKMQQDVGGQDDLEFYRAFFKGVDAGELDEAQLRQVAEAMDLSRFVDTMALGFWMPRGGAASPDLLAVAKTKGNFNLQATLELAKGAIAAMGTRLPFEAKISPSPNIENSWSVTISKPGANGVIFFLTQRDDFVYAGTMPSAINSAIAASQGEEDPVTESMSFERGIPFVNQDAMVWALFLSGDSLPMAGAGNIDFRSCSGFVDGTDKDVSFQLTISFSKKEHAKDMAEGLRTGLSQVRPYIGGEMPEFAQALDQIKIGQSGDVASMSAVWSHSLLLDIESKIRELMGP